ncbi:hypothetical protein DRI50_03900, partial [candidate division KSB1 bacterium]
MKLKYKLFLSYLVLIFIFSGSLIWLLGEMQELSFILQRHVEQDVQSIIDLSSQLQSLENLNANYILLFLPGHSTAKILQLERSRLNYAQNWSRLKERLRGIQNPTGGHARVFGQWYRMIVHSWRPAEDSLLNQKASQLIAKVNAHWLNVNNGLKQSVQAIRKDNISRARYLRDTLVKKEIQSLRRNLAKLNHVIGQQSIARSEWMAGIARKTQTIIWMTEIFLLVLA